MSCATSFNNSRLMLVSLGRTNLDGDKRNLLGIGAFEFVAA